MIKLFGVEHNNFLKSSFSTFVFDLDEEPLSCDQDNFACGNVMYYGINDDYPATKGGPVLCEGGSLPNPSGGIVSLEDAIQNFPAGSSLLDASSELYDSFTGYIGITNGDGTGSMDAWILINDSDDF